MHKNIRNCFEKMKVLLVGTKKPTVTEKVTRWSLSSLFNHHRKSEKLERQAALQRGNDGKSAGGAKLVVDLWWMRMLDENNDIGRPDANARSITSELIVS